MCSPSTGTCVCSTTFTGPDCGTVSCPYACMGRGTCSPAGYCDCDPGFTGIDCATPRLPYAPLPYGVVFPSEQEYAGDDAYGDVHPVFNASVIATAAVQIKQQALLSLLTPANQVSESYQQAAAFRLASPSLEGGANASQPGLDILGFSSRRNLKKGWKLSFSKFVKGQRIATGLQRLAFKTDMHTFLNQLTVELYRAWPVPAQRGGFAQLAVNDVSMGYFWVEEVVDAQFLQSRFADASGNLYKGVASAYLTVLGDGSPQAYAGATFAYWGSNVSYYEQVEGDGDWSDFAGFVGFVNGATDEAFAEGIEGRFDVESFLRTTVVEAIGWDHDGYSFNGKNYFIYFPKAAPAVFFRHDFDSQRLIPDANLTDFGSPEAVLFARVMAVPRFRTRFLQLLDLFLAKVFNPASPLCARAAQLGAYMRVMTSASDPNWDMLQRAQDLVDPFAPDFAQQYVTFVAQRYQNLQEQLAYLLPEALRVPKEEYVSTSHSELLLYDVKIN